MKKQTRSIPLAAGLALAALGAQAQSVTNGSLTGPIANGGTPPGWTIFAGSPDTMDAGDNVGVSGNTDFGALPSASPDGGTWVGIGSDVGFVERFGQTITGLTAGQSYTVSWVDGNFGYSPTFFGYVNPNAVKVSLDGVAAGTGGTITLGSAWYAESVTFVATGSSETLTFELATDARSYMSVDGIQVSSAVPEPATTALLLAGLGVVGLAARRRR